MKRINVLLGSEVKNKNILLSYWSILFENIHNLKINNFDVNFFYEINDFFLDADVIILSSRFFYKKNNENIDIILSALEKIYNINSNILWFDLRDSAGTTQFEVMPFVKKYLKGQIYKDFNYYSIPMYGGRFYTNYYHLNNKIIDKIEYRMSLLNIDDYNKLKLSWNIGTLRYDLRFSKFFKIASYNKLLNNFFIKNNFTSYKSYDAINRVYRVNGIFNKEFERNSISFQRLLATKKLKNNNMYDLIDKKLSAKKYINSICKSKVVLSLFGWGEVCYRDWESVILGTPFIKPDMSYLETWPNIYIPNKTYYPVYLNLENLEEVIDLSVNSSEKSKQITKTAQNIIKSLRINNGNVFCEKFKEIVNI